VHPGWAATDQSHGWLLTTLTRLFAQPAAAGALPALYAATMPDITGGEFLGPDGLLGVRGNPRRIRPPAKALDGETAQRLWAASEKLTAVDYDAPAGGHATRATDA
jgi:hypothetical protein